MKQFKKKVSATEKLFHAESLISVGQWLHQLKTIAVPLS